MYSELRMFRQIYKCGLTIFTVIPLLNDPTLSTQVISRTKSLLEDSSIFPIKSTKSPTNHKLTCMVEENANFYVNNIYYTKMHVQTKFFLESETVTYFCQRWKSQFRKFNNNMFYCITKITITCCGTTAKIRRYLHCSTKEPTPCASDKYISVENENEKVNVIALS